MSATTIHDILPQFREEELHNRHLGDRFERLICRYLELDPIFADRFSNVWMFNEWPKKGATGDIGIDIVAEERATGEFCGIQCKAQTKQSATEVRSDNPETLKRAVAFCQKIERNPRQSRGNLRLIFGRFPQHHRVSMNKIAKQGAEASEILPS